MTSTSGDIYVMKISELLASGFFFLPHKNGISEGKVHCKKEVDFEDGC